MKELKCEQFTEMNYEEMQQVNGGGFWDVIRTAWHWFLGGFL